MLRNGTKCYAACQNIALDRHQIQRHCPHRRQPLHQLPFPLAPAFLMAVCFPVKGSKWGQVKLAWANSSNNEDYFYIFPVEWDSRGILDGTD
jgi:hypothetical protein